MEGAEQLTRILPVSETALLTELESPERAAALHAALARSGPSEIEELVLAARTVLVIFRAGPGRADRIATGIRTLAALAPEPAQGAAIELPVRYDGEDLGPLADLLGVSAAELARRHAEASWRVAFLGFAPGFAYLRCDDPLFEVPRLAAPRTRVPAGSVALAGHYSGVYPRSSPGGWQLIGRTDATLWDARLDPPALLRPGTQVRFTPVTREIVPVRDAPVRVPEVSRSGRAIVVERPGFQLLLQDLGRPGRARLGVSRSGAADRRALRAANRLVGNDPGAAALEIAGGAELRARGSALLAYAGAPTGLTLTAPDEEEHEPRDAPLGGPFVLRSGERLRIGPASRGVRGYLAVRGGFDAVPVLGSRASDTLSGLGPPPPQAGAVLPVALPRGPAAAVLPSEPLPELPAPGEEILVDMLPGPRRDWLAPEGLAALRERSWLVTGASDRIGLRLRGDAPLLRSRTGELEPEGLVPGAVQLPPDGQPVIFLADVPVTGGYPVIGVIVADQHALLGQVPPGARIRFRMQPGPLG